MCGLVITTDGDRVTGIRGDTDDPLSKGHICPKAVALQDVHSDPDRLRHPVKRVGDTWERISWDEAYALVAVRCEHVPPLRTDGRRFVGRRVVGKDDVAAVLEPGDAAVEPRELPVKPGGAVVRRDRDGQQLGHGE